ncbi:CocE/NonD family hydrolase [Paenibacillus alginolyticus]|uniref:CocE/NonD family hydrolase n=1 Tax=Paenibacillus alginolyticus TaxID=59839 RepID=A0ABT4GAN2_9BACL|nr:CocE/NonD family hydrolase [Paenibacillus alginolyticus]MCY9693168.1 CocE/NonD family hydrolase [Paenibacillus alginolyticus]MEC0144537.1 CocE/NonD family hydrolase [Paenibacillus alginolyticus]
MLNHDVNKQFYVQMRDGVRLSTHVKLPKNGGPWPVIFGRSPYSHALTAWLQKAEYWSEQGYAFVYQECRGTGQSEGVWLPFVHEMEDGLDSIDWIIRQDWTNGNIGTYGASYSGTLQWCMAEHLPPEVKTMFISVAGIERYRQNYMNGMFRHDIYTVWALGNSGHQPIRSTEGLYQEALSVRPHIDMDERLFGHILPWYREWVSNVDEGSAYWNSGLWAEFKEIPRKLKVPVMMVAGWFDHNLEASILSYKKLPEDIRQNSCFIIGPWVHTLDISGDLEFPNQDVWGPQQDKAALAWFDHHLKGKPIDNYKGTVQTYLIGEGCWRSWDGWIQSAGTVRYYLTFVQGTVQGLTCEKPLQDQSVSFDYDPKHPVPTKGGAALMAYLTGTPDASRPASVLQDNPGKRKDVISFISDELKEDLRIAGRIKAHLVVSSDAEDTSFTVCVIEQFADGTSCNIRDGITSLRYRNNRASPYEPNDTAEAEIELWPITWTIQKGSKLRVDISSSNFPAYHLHLNTAGPWALQEEIKIAKQTIYAGGVRYSWIEIPVID